MSIRSVLPLPVLPILLATALPLAAQDELPSHLEALEVARSRKCVDVLTRLERLDTQLAPSATRAQRLLAIGGAVQLEESAIVDSLQVADPLESAVADWFRADQALAQRYVNEQSQSILDQRAEGRHAIQERLTAAIDSIQAHADSIVSATGTLRADAAACSGAILIRGPAIDACTGITSRVCTAARDTVTADELFPFVDSADFLWNRQQFRPWTQPGPIQAAPGGQLTGARTVGSTRVGNIVLNVSFSPLLRARADLQPEQLATLDSIDTALGIENIHPDVSFAPALSFQVNLPEALADETQYVLHFGPPESPDIVWTAEANTGQPLVGSVALAPEHVARLRAGDPITLTAVRETEAGDPEARFAIELSSVNQVARIEALLAYMTRQLSADLARIIPPPAADSTAGGAN